MKMGEPLTIKATAAGIPIVGLLTPDYKAYSISI